MFLKRNKPYTPSMRFKMLVDKSILSNMYLKPLVTKKRKIQGINNKGKKIVRHKGGEKKNFFLFIDFYREINYNVPHIVKFLCYDSNRSSFIALILSLNGVFSYILSSRGLFIGSKLYNWNDKNIGFISDGDHLMLKNIPFGMFFFNINKKFNLGYSIAKSSGTYCQFINKIFNTNKSIIRIPSGKKIILDMNLKASIGVCSNPMHKYENIGKAGRNRNLGIRPTVRGVAMNPIDHPHGGGEGKKSGRVCPFSPWRKQPFFKKK